VILDQVVATATIAAAVGCGMVTGLLFVFSVAIMPALGRQPAPAGIAAMQSINSAILNPLFLVLFGGSAVLCVLLGATAPFTAVPGTAWRLAGAVLYLAGPFVVTMAVNVPLNNALDAVDPAGAEGARVWAGYLSRWTAWNHVRTAMGVAATVAMAVAGA
jgi:Predicted integral membrane protein